MDIGLLLRLTEHTEMGNGRGLGGSGVVGMGYHLALVIPWHLVTARGRQPDNGFAECWRRPVN